MCCVLENEEYLSGLSNKDHIYHLKARLITANKVCTLIDLDLASILMAHFQNRVVIKIALHMYSTLFTLT